MIISVRNYRGCRAADIELAPLALIAGRNGAGKSSLCEAAAAALAGRPLPLKLARKDAVALVSDGESCGAVTVRCDDALASVSWPRAEVSSEGRPPEASEIAVGLLKVLKLSAKDRAALLTDLLHARPTADDFAEAYKAIDPLGDDEAGRLNAWARVEHLGWDEAHKQTAEAATKGKGGWEHVTGQRWGSKVAVDWRPAGWTADLETQDQVDLAVAVTHAETRHRQVIVAAAGNSAALTQAQRRLQQANDLAQKLDEGKTALAEAEAEVAAAEAARDALPPVGGDSGLPCPHCGGRIRVTIGKGDDAGIYHLEPGAEPVDRDTHDARHKALVAAQKRLKDAQARLRDVRRGVAKVEAAAEEAAKLRDEVARLQAEPADTGDPAALQAAETALAEANARLARWKAARDAARLAAGISRDLALTRILAPDGLRLGKLTAQLDAFNAAVAALAAEAGWPAPTIDAGMEVYLCGRPPELWAKSERYRVNVLLQAAIAQRDGSEALIVDAADLLDQHGRNSLFALLAAVGKPAIVAVTMSALQSVPDLAAAGLGRSYWVDAGVVQPLTMSTQQAAE
jgi:hypothetical protein